MNKEEYKSAGGYVGGYYSGALGVPGFVATDEYKAKMTEHFKNKKRFSPIEVICMESWFTANMIRMGYSQVYTLWDDDSLVAEHAELGSLIKSLKYFSWVEVRYSVIEDLFKRLDEGTLTWGYARNALAEEYLMLFETKWGDDVPEEERDDEGWCNYDEVIAEYAAHHLSGMTSSRAIAMFSLEEELRESSDE